jgi:outer membrane protein TolC
MTVSLLFGAFFALGQSGPNGVLTVEEAIAIAEKNAFSIAIQRANIEKSRQRVNEGAASLGPKINSSVGYTRYDDVQSSTFGGQTFVTQPVDNKTLSASVSLPIDISGNLNRLVRAYQANEKAARYTLLSVYNDLRLNVRSAYYRVLNAKDTITVQNQALKDAQENLVQTQKLFNADQRAKVDVTRAQATVAQAQYNLIAAQNSLELAKNALNYAIARPIETPVDVTDVVDLPPVAIDVNQSVELAMKSRPEVLASQSTLEALRLITRATESGLNPSLSLGANYSRNLDPFNGARATSGAGTLTLSIPIFDSGATRARVRQARQDELITRTQLEQTQLGISQDVRSAVNSLTSARARLLNAQTQVALAQEVFRLAQVRRDAGEGTYVEIIDAETDLTRARNGLVSARYDYLTAYAQLQRALGRDDVSGGTK